VRVSVTADAIDPEIVRVEYDLDATMQGIRDSELPDEFAEYLRTGGNGEGR
jgi:hypothetical protein